MAERQMQWGIAELSYTEKTIDFSSFESISEELAHDFHTVRISRRSAGPMASPLFGDVAIAFILGASSAAFFSELGKDAYRALKSGLFQLYTRALTWANGRGYDPFAVDVTPEGSLESGLHFTFPAGLTEEQFMNAVGSIHEVIAPARGNGPAGFVYDPSKGWTRDEG